MQCKIIYALKKKKFGIFVELKNFSQQIIYFVLSKISNSNETIWIVEMILEQINPL